MHLTYRPAWVADVEACVGLLPPEFVCPPVLRARLSDVWCRWLGERAMLLTVIEDQERVGESRLVGFGSSVFVTDAFAEEAQSGLPPPVAAQVARRFLEGASPVLTRDAVARANAGAGLNLLVLVIGWGAGRLSDEEVRRVKAKLLEALVFTHGGYKLERVMQEVYSSAEMERGLVVGTRLLTDYGRFYETGELPLPAPETRPYLIGARRDEVKDGSTLAPLFFHTPPRFRFRAGEQEILLQALLGESDEELAQTLHVSLSTVHKRWRAIYERVGSASPDLLPSGRDGNRRGAEKRRHLLSFLRSHLEELRPMP